MIWQNLEIKEENMELEKLFKEMEKNTILINFEKKMESELSIGVSKFGGRPDLPEDFEWFYYEGKGYKGKVENRPLSFLVQINCKEIKEYDKENQLPDSGMLYFFYEMETMTWGFSPEDRGSAKVFYYNGDISKLKKREFPKELDKDYKMPEKRIVFSNRKDVPSYEEFDEILNDMGYEDIDDEFYDEYEEKLVKYIENDSNTISKFLGYADTIQGDMKLECEEVTNGISCGKPHELEKSMKEKMNKGSKEWQLLFQLDTVEDDDFELMFGDCGRIYYFIKKDELKKKNFDSSWLILQCY